MSFNTPTDTTIWCLCQELNDKTFSGNINKWNLAKDATATLAVGTKLLLVRGSVIINAGESDEQTLIADAYTSEEQVVPSGQTGQCRGCRQPGKTIRAAAGRLRPVSGLPDLTAAYGSGAGGMGSGAYSVGDRVASGSVAAAHGGAAQLTGASPRATRFGRLRTITLSRRIVCL